tara:strand:- start:2289 stop:2534 length:246 start_codon:yes stop_codon:yes gene_type:complete
LFEPGDLVQLKPNTGLYEMIESGSNVGIVVSPAILMYIHASMEGDRREFWAYNVIFDGREYRNIPQEVLRGLKNEDEENIK